MSAQRVDLSDPTETSAEPAAPCAMDVQTKVPARRTQEDWANFLGVRFVMTGVRSQG